MNELFLKVIDMSISASWLILAVLILRLVLNKAPKWVNVLLWGIVAVRLIFPFSIESALSLIPRTEMIPVGVKMDTNSAIDSSIHSITKVLNPTISQSNIPFNRTSINPLQSKMVIWENIWVLGIIVLLIYTAISYLCLRRKIRTAVILRDNIFQSENVSSPFVLGIIKPKIYLPFDINELDMENVIAHELAHIQRKDCWWKPLGFILLTIHWLNPLMWWAYALLCRDIELACDEKVIKEWSNEQRANYTQALLACSVNQDRIVSCPLAFGEVSVKERVKSVMNYKKPGFWIIILAIIICVVVAVCFLTNPVIQYQPVKWFDYTDDLSLEGYYNEPTIEIPEFPGVIFRASTAEIVASKPFDGTDLEEETVLISGLLILNAYFCDITGDGLPEICATRSFGSGMIDERIIVYDYAKGESYELADRGTYNYYLRWNEENSTMYVDRKIFGNDKIVFSGELIFSEESSQIRFSDDGIKPQMSFCGVRLGETRIDKEVITVTEDGASMDYQLAYSYGGYIIEIGLISEDGTEIAKTIKGGSATGTIEKIPAGNYQLFVRIVGGEGKEDKEVLSAAITGGAMVCTLVDGC